ncbi:NADH-ubiquinone oxidoreductase 30.4 kDa subunit, mitochondrial [Cladophialophora yegresii CBS 114405]|uniref:NADH-ubiquinone oxidoreductase 30.4 kDa subunit, mitochondrial n=1 Tax=Cladophialophora yegresii CBS 114405 TaxID=1182544 RepID=W9VP88_9EURO|nr:NADH-ubiquinone oxidoreductase 30.4 kDa subunit, mitochondrial [Cladophialophora yegresii CBS 114405]EXJ53936.1 NADH-ubiquinone oxidoreductase 30.4 kDa subunit, mitochondrial [Cladophialophora yegresii CBS 114405]
MASAKTVLRLASKRPLGSAPQSSKSVQRATFSQSTRQSQEKAGSKAIDERTPAPDLLSELRKAPRPPMGKLSAPIVNDADKYADKALPLHQYGQYLMSCLPKYIQQFSVWKDELCIYIPPSGVIPVFSFLKYHTAAEYTMVASITGVDFPTKNYRFEVVYNLLSVRHNSRIRVKTYADETSPVPSITSLYDGANWYEREVYDLYGVFFTDHPDLRRIMTDYGFDGHPLRKDFPLTGYTEIRYDEEKKRIVVEPLEMTQAFRNFEGGTSAWEQVGVGSDRKPPEFRLPTPKPEEKKEEKK